MNEASPFMLEDTGAKSNTVALGAITVANKSMSGRLGFNWAVIVTVSCETTSTVSLLKQTLIVGTISSGSGSSKQ